MSTATQGGHQKTETGIERWTQVTGVTPQCAKPPKTRHTYQSMCPLPYGEKQLKMDTHPRQGGKQVGAIMRCLGGARTPICELGDRTRILILVVSLGPIKKIDSSRKWHACAARIWTYHLSIMPWTTDRKRPLFGGRNCHRNCSWGSRVWVGMHRRGLAARVCRIVSFPALSIGLTYHLSSIRGLSSPSAPRKQSISRT